MTDRRAALVERALQAVTLSAYEKGNNLQLSTEDLAAAIDTIRNKVLEEVASLAFLRPLVEEQAKGEWDDKTIDEDVAMFAAAIRALKGDSNDV